MKKLFNVVSTVLICLVFLNGCELSKEHVNKIRKDVDAHRLVASLRKDSLFKKFNGYGVTPRDEYYNIYIFSIGKNPNISYWLKYDPRGPEYFDIDKLEREKNLLLIKKLYPTDYLEKEKFYLQKAFELITILKRLDIKWANAEFGKFQCSFNDSSRLMYVKKSDILDSSFYRFHKNIKWIDSNFVTYN